MKGQFFYIYLYLLRFNYWRCNILKVTIGGHGLLVSKSYEKKMPKVSLKWECPRENNLG